MVFVYLISTIFLRDRQNGTAEVYAYLPPDDENEQVLSKVPPLSVLNPEYGFSIGRGSWAFIPGQWMTVAIRARLNVIGNRDGMCAQLNERFSRANMLQVRLKCL